jgi:CRISPR system Cascade subunit CasC
VATTNSNLKRRNKVGAKFIELHALQSYAASNLNRDDLGYPKTVSFGGADRARISSQCLKQAWRKSGFFPIEVPANPTFRTRKWPGKLVERLKTKGDGELADKAEQVAKNAAKIVSAEGGGESAGALETKQVIAITEAELDIMADKLAEYFEKEGKIPSQKECTNLIGPVLKEKKLRASVDIALFGRMITSEAIPNIDASTQVAHAMSTHEVKTQFDYFTAVDQLQEEEETGAGHVNEAFFNSAVYYKYWLADYERLLNNLDKNKELTVDALASLVRATVLAHPSGKQNSYASHTPPDFLLIEVKRDAAPINLANAFLSPVRTGDDLMLDSINALAAYSKKIDAYGQKGSRFALVTKDGAELPNDTVRVSTLNELVEKLRAELNGAD